MGGAGWVGGRYVAGCRMCAAARPADRTAAAEPRGSARAARGWTAESDAGAADPSARAPVPAFHRNTQCRSATARMLALDLPRPPHVKEREREREAGGKGRETMTMERGEEVPMHAYGTRRQG